MARGLSTYNIYTARKQNRREIKVTMGSGFITRGPDLSDDMLVLSASNPGHRAVTVTGVGILLPDGRARRQNWLVVRWVS